MTKTNLFKRMLAIFISVLMITTSLPFAAITASADTGDKYLFAYFSGDDTVGQAVTKQKVRLAVSSDGINYTPLNSGKPILDANNPIGTIKFQNTDGQFAHTQGVRDPYIIAKHDTTTGAIIKGYYIVATDLCVFTGAENNSYNNTKMLVWDVDDLSDVSDVKPTVIDTAGMFNDSTLKTNKDSIAWAPEVTWDYEKNMYVLFWSGPTYTNSRLNYAYTTDFQTFYNKDLNVIDGKNYIPSVLFHESGNYVIDGSIAHDNGYYYLAYKREKQGNTKLGQIYFVKATTIAGLDGQTGVKFYDSNFPGENTGNKQGLEGPELYKNAAGNWVMVVDNFTVNPETNYLMYELPTLDDYMAGASVDRASARVTSSNINTISPRHGGVATITTEEYNALIEAYSGEATNVVAQYFTTSDTTYDATGHGYTLTSNLSSTSFAGKDNVAYFDNNNKMSNSGDKKYAYVTTSQMFSDYNFKLSSEITFEWDAYDLHNSAQSNNYSPFVTMAEGTNLNYGNIAADSTSFPQNATKHFFAHTGGCTGIANGLGTGQGNGNPNYIDQPLSNQWVSYKLVLTKAGKLDFYRNGTLFSTISVPNGGIDDAWVASIFGNGTLTFGTSLFGDPMFYGYISNFRISITKKLSAKEICEKKIDKAKVETANDNIHFANGGNIISNGILYSANDSLDSNYFKSSVEGNEFGINTYPSSSRVVYLLDKPTGTIEYPLISKVQCKNKTGITLYWGINYISLNNSNNWYLNTDWLSTSASNNWTDTSAGQDNGQYGIYKVSYTLSKNTNANLSMNNKGPTAGHYKKKDDFSYVTLRNILKQDYTSANLTDTYYVQYNMPTFILNVDAGGTWIINQKGAWNDREVTNSAYMTSITGIYGLNYYPLANILNNIKSDFATISQNEWMYTEESLEAYYIAAADVLDFSLSDYDFANNTGLTNAASTIKRIVEAYKLPTKKVFTLKFVDENGISVEQKNITAGDPIGAFPAIASPIVSNDDKATHKITYWNTTLESSSIITMNTTIERMSEDIDCSFVDGVCSECGQKNLDFTAYDAAVTDANSKVKAEYTEDSWDALQTALTTYVDIKTTAANQTAVNNATSAIQTAINGLERKVTTKTITFIKETDGQDPVVEEIEAEYGDEIRLDAPGAYKWVRTYNDVDTVYAKNVDSTVLVVTGSITITAHIAEEKEATAQSVKVTLLDKQGKSAGIAYASNGVINVGEEITVDALTLEPVQVPLYRVSGYTINDTQVTGNYSIPADTTEVVIKPIYTAGSTLTITTNATIKNNSGTSYEAKWDERITLVSDTEVAWTSNGVVLATGKTYSFRANEAIYITAEELPATVTPTAKVGYFNYDVELNKVTLVNTFFTAGGTATEAGIILSTKTDNRDDIILTGKKFGSSNFTRDQNQLKISVSRTANTAFTMYAVAYVIVDGVTYYANEVATCNYVPQA